MPQARRQPGVRDERAVAGAERRRRPGDSPDLVGKDQDGISRPVSNNVISNQPLLQILEFRSDLSDTIFYCSLPSSDLTGIIEPFGNHLKIAGKGSNDLKYGVLVKPHISMNYGPLYMAKIARTQ